MPKKNTSTTPQKKRAKKAAPKKVSTTTKRAAKPKRVSAKKKKPSTKAPSVATTPVVASIPTLPTVMAAAPLSVPSFAATPHVHNTHLPHAEARILLIGEYYLIIVLCAIIGIGCMYAILAWL